MTIRFAALTLVLLGFAGRSDAAFVVDFESLPTTPVASYTDQGVTFTPNLAPGATGTIRGALAPNGTRGILPPSITQSTAIRATFSVLASSVSVDLGDFGGDPDDLFLRAFDQSGNLISQDTASISFIFQGMVTLRVTGNNNIASVVFGGLDPFGGNSVFGDNLVVETAAIPEPSSLAMLGIAGGVFSLARVARRAKARG